VAHHNIHMKAPSVVRVPSSSVAWRFQNVDPAVDPFNRNTLALPSTQRAMLRSIPQTVYDLVSSGAARAPLAPALRGPLGEAINYETLLRQLRLMGTALHGVGIGRNSRVVVALPSGTEAVVTTLGVAAYATAIPVDPAVELSEVGSIFERLDPAAVMAPAREASTAREAAYARGTMVIEVEGLGHGIVNPCTATTGCSATPLPAQANDVAVQFARSTKSTGSPLTHGRMVEAGAHLAASLHIAPHHRCMNLLPMWGRAASITEICATLHAGACVVCPPKVRAAELLTWLDLCRPTWFTADAHTQRAIIDLARSNPSACIEAVGLGSTERLDAAQTGSLRERTFLTRRESQQNEA